MSGNPETILRTLDGYLTDPTELIIYGRAALDLGYPASDSDRNPDFSSTLDVDAILPSEKIETIDQDDQFWNAIERTNEDLSTSGLYITHLFQDDQVILRPQWLSHIEPIHLSPPLALLQLARPHTIDLALTKMMRIDPQDREDLLFLTSTMTTAERQAMTASFSTALSPQIPEILEAFEANQIWLKDNE